MKHHPVFRITKEDLERVRVLARDHSVFDELVRWSKRGEALDSLIRDIEVAFTGVTLRTGTGLLEANGRDDYAAEDELAELRSRDEHTDWRRIDIETLSRCYTAPTFMNARGFVFHLPAFSIAQLNDGIGHDYIDRLLEADGFPDNWMPLLTDAQRDAIISVLSEIVEHPNYSDRIDEITKTINRLNEGRGTNG